jgi:transposase
MNRLGGSVAPRGSSEDPKVTALRESRCLNPHSGQVTDQTFLTEEFFDARDAVQVKYEMVRAVTVDGAPVTATAAAFGYSRPSYYQAAAALAESGLDGLVPARPGPRGGHKLTGQILTWAEQQLAADPTLKAAGLADPIAAEFGVRVHPRSIERALARRREHPQSR